MPFQSEKQRRYLHANHPEIAQRWERDYANGGISNHFRRKFFTGALADTQGPAGGQAMSPGTSTTGGTRHGGGGGNGGGGGGPPLILNPPKGPSPAEIAAQKAAAQKKAMEEAQLQAKELAMTQRAGTKKKVKHLEKIKAFGVNEYEKLIKPGVVAYQKKHMPTYDEFGEELQTEGLLKNLELIKALQGETKPTQKIDKKKSEEFWSGEGGKLAKLSTKGLIEYNKLINKKNANTATDGMTPPLTDKEKERLKQLEKDKEAKLTTDSVTMIGAEGGVARKNYFHGGILGLNESEEIISDDGNDIELTAYNAEFDDPNDLSTGVKSLFMKKGGNVRLGPHTATDLLAKKNPDGTRSKYQPPGGGATSLGSGRDVGRGSPQAGTAGSTGWGGPEKTPSPYRGQHDWDVVTKPGEGNVVVDIGPEREEPYEIVDGQKVPLSLRGVKGIDPREDPGREDKLRTYTQRMNDIQNEIKEKWRRKIDPTLWEQIKDMPTISFVGILTAIAKDIYDKREMKKDMELLASLGLDKGHPMGSDTAYSQLQDYFAKIKLRKKDDDKGDRPEQIEVVPIREEIEAYEDVYAMSPWERMKANQAKRALLVEKGIIQDNPIVDESVTDITMQANSGGLANLFRVKNQ